MAKVKGKRGREDCFLLVSLDQTSYAVCTASLRYLKKNTTTKGAVWYEARLLRIHSLHVG